MKKIVQFYAYVHEFFHRSLNVNIPGLGFLYRQLKSDFFIDVKGRKLFFNHKAADNYIRLINGNFNEPETHSFLDYVFENCGNKNFHFIDVGGNIGEFVLDYSLNPGIKKVTVFEPQPEQIKAITKTIQENQFLNTTLIPKPVCNRVENILFNFNSKNATASGISNKVNVGTEIQATTLDKEIQNLEFDYVILVDVEGAELKVFEGGEKLIKEKQPLIIFEYNHVTRLSFTIEEAALLLGENYELYRLRRDGKLDKNFDKTWNLVALPKGLLFKSVNELIK